MKDRKVLFMDDDELIREVVGEMLESIGYQVEFAGDGREAIARYQAAKAAGQPFDVVIMDLTVRDGMGGKEAIQQLLAIDPAAKAIVSSGYSDDPVMAHCNRYGFKGFVSKPYSLEELDEVLRQVIEG